MLETRIEFISIVNIPFC